MNYLGVVKSDKFKLNRKKQKARYKTEKFSKLIWCLKGGKRFVENFAEFRIFFQKIFQF